MYWLVLLTKFCIVVHSYNNRKEVYCKNENENKVKNYGSKVIVEVKVDNRQTDKQTDRQDKNNMPPIIRSGGIKNVERRAVMGG